MTSKNLLKSAAAFGALIALGACGGGTAPQVNLSTGALDLELPTAAEIAAMPVELQTLLSDLETLNETTDLTAALPTTGTATYAGNFGISLDNDTGTLIHGTADLTAEFAIPDVSGTLTPTEIYDDGMMLAHSGTISVGGATFTGSTFEAGMSGTLTVEGQGYDVSGGVNGAFTGDNADNLIGSLDVYVDDLSTADTNDDTGGGAFVTTRQ